MSAPEASGWKALVEGWPWYDGKNDYRIPAYSEFMPPPRVGCNLAGEIDRAVFADDDPYGWRISEVEEEYELRPGLEHIAQEIMAHLRDLMAGGPAHHIAGHERANLMDNPYWPPELAEHAPRIEHERYVLLLPLALSRTQDDMGRVRWTYFGGSEQGPERAFWRSFYDAPGRERPHQEAIDFFARLLKAAYAEEISGESQLRAVLRILPTGDEPLPAWTTPFIVPDGAIPGGVRYLLTFRPFSRLPEPVQTAYRTGKLALLPCPASLVFWGMPTYRQLEAELPLAMQIPLQRLAGRHGGPDGLRVPQAGRIDVPRADLKPSQVQAELLRDTYRRTNRWNRVHRYDDELALNPRVDKITRVLFSTDLDALGLYDKPMARNSQVWTSDHHLLLDGPLAARADIDRAKETIVAGGLFGYRFQFPAMRTGVHEVYWHRPLAAYWSPHARAAEVVPDAPTGWLTAYRAGAIDRAHPVELWPRIMRREPYLSALRDFDVPERDHYRHQTALNIVALLDAAPQFGDAPLPRSFARHLLRAAKDESLEEWLANLGARSNNRDAVAPMRATLEALLEPAGREPPPPVPLTFARTSTRAFEEMYWQTIATLAHGRYVNKDNADPVLDEATRAHLKHPHRDLERLGAHLLEHHAKAIADAGMSGRALCGELPFRWATDFDFPLFGGWQSNQSGQELERDLLVVIPGRNRGEAVIFADHYDTAYMEDVYDKSRGGNGARLSAEGADDNYSATATLLLAAPIFLAMAREGRLARDVWLLHLTGEEFPADCLGARHICERLVEGRLQLAGTDGATHDLSGTRVTALYVMDMIAHNRDNARDIFQISPGRSRGALRAAYQAHLANLSWNALAGEWNEGPERSGLGRGERSADGSTLPAIAQHPRLHGEVRTDDDPQSSLYNTDGQIFTDAGIPAVLLMENYDINRTGYHDTHDTMELIDLDYGVALAAIAIESAARAATEPEP